MRKQGIDWGKISAKDTHDKKKDTVIQNTQRSPKTQQ
jgi:hypothetical protein